jgi:hypothetical protein
MGFVKVRASERGLLLLVKNAYLWISKIHNFEGMNIQRNIRTIGNAQIDPIGVNQYGTTQQIDGFYFISNVSYNEKYPKVFGYHCCQTLWLIAKNTFIHKTLIMLEKDFEDIICKYPELIEEGLILIGRQLSLYGRRMDIIFEDKFKRKLIIELKAGPIKDDHIGQILSYEGMLLSADDPTLRVMLVGTRVPPNIQRSLDHHGIAWKEITFSFLKDFLKNKGDDSFNHLFEYDEPVIKKRIIEMQNEFPQQNSFEDMKYNLDLIERLKSSDNYKSFKDILPKKIDNETEAKEIIEKNIGHLNVNDLKKVIELINYPHQYKMIGKINKQSIKALININ